MTNIIIEFAGPATAPVVRPAPAAAEIQAERQRLAAIKRVHKAGKLKKGLSHG